MWTYESSTGKLFDAAMNLEGAGYAGGGCDKTNAEAAAGKNNPDLQSVHNVGPLPVGRYTFNAPVDTRTHGPYVLWLAPDPDNEMFGRDAFGLHGDSVVDPGWASDGCIVQAHSVRVKVWESGDTRLEVVAKVS